MDAFNRPRAEPMFNVPPVVLALTGALVVGASRSGSWSGARPASTSCSISPSFRPATPMRRRSANCPAASAAEVWTFVTYALLHADWTHLTVNSVWLLAFGSAVAWRFGTARFLGFFAMTAAAGAAAHLVLHIGEPLPLVGASAALSGLHGGGGALRVRGRRAAGRLPRTMARRPIACRRCRSPRRCAIRASSRSWRCGSAAQLPVRPGQPRQRLRRQHHRLGGAPRRLCRRSCRLRAVRPDRRPRVIVRCETPLRPDRHRITPAPPARP